MTYKQLLTININTQVEPIVATPGQIFNYFIIALSVVTSLICLGQFLKKLHTRAKRSPLISYGLQASLKIKSDKRKGDICKCSHRYKLHVVGSPAVVSSV